jgi:hypothetical protein
LLQIKIIMKKTILNFASIVLLTSAIITTSCNKDDSGGIVSAPDKSKLMVVHASPDAPGVDFLVDGTKQNSAALTFPNNTAYLDILSGSRNLKVNAAGTTTTVINATVPFTKNTNYTLFAVDSLSKISTVLLTDNLAAPASGNAHVRFVHLSPNAPAVDIAVTGGSVLLPNTAFKGSTAFTPVLAGTYNLEVRVAGTTNVALPLPGVVLQAGKIYTVFAKGFLGGTGAQALDAGFIINN